MWDAIIRAKSEHSRYYEEQRTDPHYLVPEKSTEFMFERAEPGDVVTSIRLQRCAAVISAKALLNKVDDVMLYIKENNGVIDDHVHEDGEVAEDASSITSAPTVRERIVQSIAQNVALDDNVSN
jgi:hypothetical protein